MMGGEAKDAFPPAAIVSDIPSKELAMEANPGGVASGGLGTACKEVQLCK